MRGRMRGRMRMIRRRDIGISFMFFFNCIGGGGDHHEKTKSPQWCPFGPMAREGGDSKRGLRPALHRTRRPGVHVVSHALQGRRMKQTKGATKLFIPITPGWNYGRIKYLEHSSMESINEIKNRNIWRKCVSWLKFSI
jgi:hypothetical protein